MHHRPGGEYRLLEPHPVVRQRTLPGGHQHGRAIPQARGTLFHLPHNPGNRPHQQFSRAGVAFCRNGPAGDSRNTQSQGPSVLRTHLERGGNLSNKPTIDFRLPLQSSDRMGQRHSNSIADPSELFLSRCAPQIKPFSRPKA